MREIKFRAWDIRSRRMITSTCNHYVGFNGSLYWQFGYDTFDPLSMEDYILMQFTGLEDKDGKEIYEGDIIEFNDPDDYERGEITYLSGAFYYLCVDGSQDLLSDCQLTEMPIIGNIYKNPELVS